MARTSGFKPNNPSLEPRPTLLRNYQPREFMNAVENRRLLLGGVSPVCLAEHFWSKFRRDFRRSRKSKAFVNKPPTSPPAKKKVRSQPFRWRKESPRVRVSGGYVRERCGQNFDGVRGRFSCGKICVSLVLFFISPKGLLYILFAYEIRYSDCDNPTPTAAKRFMHSHR